MSASVFQNHTAVGGTFRRTRLESSRYALAARLTGHFNNTHSISLPFLSHYTACYWSIQAPRSPLSLWDDWRIVRRSSYGQRTAHTHKQRGGVEAYYCTHDRAHTGLAIALNSQRTHRTVRTISLALSFSVALPLCVVLFIETDCHRINECVLYVVGEAEKLKQEH